VPRRPRLCLAAAFLPQWESLENRVFGFRLSVIVQALLLVGGLIWCKEIFGRLREDVAEMRDSADVVHKSVIVLFWAVTAVIIFFMARFIWWIVSSFVTAARQL